MPLREHLVELRHRLVLSAIGLVVGAVVGWLLYDPVIAELQRPLLELADDRDRVGLNFAGVATAFDVRVKVSLFIGVLVASPWWLLQLWLFVTPGLTSKERRYAVGFLAAAVPLFLSGALLAWRVLPNAIPLLIDEFTPAEGVNFLDAQMYLGFVMRVILAFGVAFLLPAIMVGLNLAGLVRGRTWLAGWRWAILICFTFAALATPTPDVVSMFALALPMSALYFAAVGLGLLTDRRRSRRALAGGAA